MSIYAHMLGKVTKKKRSTIHYFCGHMYTRTFLKVHTRPRLAYALRCRGY